MLPNLVAFLAASPAYGSVHPEGSTSLASAFGPLPPQAVVSLNFSGSSMRFFRRENVSKLVDPSSFAVLENNGFFRVNTDTEFFNPTNTSPPLFQIFDSKFLGILGQNARIIEIASNATFGFAHEAPIWVPDLNRGYFASNDGSAVRDSGLDKNNSSTSSIWKKLRKLSRLKAKHPLSM